MTSIRFSIAAVAATLFTIAIPASRAADRPVDLVLVLAADVSRSIDSVEHDLQRQGYAAALTSAAVLKAIRGGMTGAIAISYVEWSGAREQAVIVDWSVIDTDAAAARFADALRSRPRSFFGSTSISGAIDFSVGHFAASGVEGPRKVIDVSADGTNIQGRPVAMARDDAVRQGVTINGLAIINDRPSRLPWPEPPLDRHFIEEVIGGPGAFLEVVRGFETFADSIRKKLVREIANAPQPPSVAQLRQ